MSINTRLGDTLEAFLDQLLAGTSGITCWRGLDTSRIYSKIGGDLSAYDVPAKVESLAHIGVPDQTLHRLKKLVARTPWSTRLSMLLAVDAWADARAFDADLDLTRVGAVVGGHNINANYQYLSRLEFENEPDFVDSMLALSGIDTDHAGCVSEILRLQGPIYTIGGACASGNTALRSAVDEILHHDLDAMLVIGPVLDFSPVELHAMALMGAISFESFNDSPERASRPFDVRREGFVPSHGGGALVLEDFDAARRRGARIYAEVVGVEANSDANHLPQPSEDGQARLMTDLLRRCGLAPEQIDFVSAHATSTPLGDITEIRSLKRVFGDHARTGLKVNAPKSLLGHTCWAAPVVETVAAVLQMRVGKLHPSINIDSLDPEIDLDVCRGTQPVNHEVHYLMKNSFGFGGINCVSILRRVNG